MARPSVGRLVLGRAALIPARLIRTIPAEPAPEAETFWQTAIDLHPGWDHVTYRDPIDPEWFPLTGRYWDRCQTGAQKAGLIRLEALWHAGGIYLDSDVELYRSLEPLRRCEGFGLWEDPSTVPDFVLGAQPEHPAIRLCLDLAIARLLDDTNRGWRFPWITGPGVTTTVLPGRSDFLLLPPATFAPYHYNERERRTEDHAALPYCFGAHHWAASWVPG